MKKSKEVFRWALANNVCETCCWGLCPKKSLSSRFLRSLVALLCRDDRSSVYPSQSVNRPFSPPLFNPSVTSLQQSPPLFNPSVTLWQLPLKSGAARGTACGGRVWQNKTYWKTQNPPATVSLEDFVSIINGNYCITNTLLLYKNLRFAQLPCARQCLIK